MIPVVWHNKSRGSSKNAVAYLQSKGIEPVEYLYLKEKPDAAAIQAVLDMLKMKPSELLRPGEALGEELGLYADGVTEEAILAAMAANAKLIQRPIVITDKGAVIARPKAAIDAIL